MLYREIIAVCSQIHTKHINTLCGQNVELYIKIQSVPRSKHTVSVIKTSQLMLYREIIAVCSQIHTKHINTLCGQNVGLYNVQTVFSYNYRTSSKDPNIWSVWFYTITGFCCFESVGVSLPFQDSHIPFYYFLSQRRAIGNSLL